MGYLKSRVLSRLHEKNKNWLCIITGATGSGKSWSALRLAEVIDPDFGIDNVVFSAEKFMELLNSGRLKKGSCIVFDEAGVGIPKRDWYTISNKMLNYILQTFRHENLGVIFTTPSFDFIDTDARKLFHSYIEAKSINKSAGLVTAVLFMVQYNPRLNKLYMKHYRDKGVRINPFRVGKPSSELIEVYEAKKIEFTSALKRDAELHIKKVKAVEKYKLTKRVSDDDLADEIAKDKVKIKRFTKRWGKRTIIDSDLLQSTYHLGTRKAFRIKKLLEEKIKQKKKN